MRIEATEFSASIASGEAPVDGNLSMITLCLPGLRLVDQGGIIRQTSLQALPAHGADLDFGHVQPAGMLGRVVKLQAVPNAIGLFRGKGIVKAGESVGVEVVHYHTDTFRMGIVHVDQLLHLGREVQLGAPLGYRHLAPASQRLDGDEDVRRALPPVLVVMARWLAGSYAMDGRVSASNCSDFSSKHTTGRSGS